MTRIFLLRLVLCLGLLGSSTLGFAQKGSHHTMKQWLEQLDLSSEQKAELEAKKSNLDAQRKALRDQEFDSHEDRRAAHRELKEQERNALQEILTEEQLGKLMALRTAAREEHREAMKNVDRKGLREALHQHHETEVLPVLRAQRAKLDANISKADQQKITVLRQDMAQLRAERKAKRADKKQERERGNEHDGMRKKRPAHAALTPEQEAQKAEVKALTEKYKPAIKALFEEIKPQAEQWRAEREAIKAEFLPDGFAEKRKGDAHHQKARHRKHKGVKAGYFLLLDPNAQETPALDMEDDQLPELDMYPNPSSTVNTINYSVQRSGKVQIFLTDRTGQVLQQLFDGQQDPGAYTLDVDVSQLTDGVYYYTIQDENGRRTEQFVVKR
ncbi:MAG: T9SS type A sorting domain-containing protein [Bacteroidota bacterium]